MPWSEVEEEFEEVVVDPYHMTELSNAIHDDRKQQGHRYEEEVVGEVHVEGVGGGSWCWVDVWKVLDSLHRMQQLYMHIK